jgi:hypothetical protein
MILHYEMGFLILFFYGVIKVFEGLPIFLRVRFEGQAPKNSIVFEGSS